MAYTNPHLMHFVVTSKSEVVAKVTSFCGVNPHKWIPGDVIDFETDRNFNAGDKEIAVCDLDGMMWYILLQKVSKSVGVGGMTVKGIFTEAAAAPAAEVKNAIREFLKTLADIVNLSPKDAAQISSPKNFSESLLSAIANAFGQGKAVILKHPNGETAYSANEVNGELKIIEIGRKE